VGAEPWVPGSSVSASREVPVLGSGVERGVLTIGEGGSCELVLEVGERSYRATGFDLFDSLVTLRGVLEAEDLLICVEGARSDVYPSGMSRQMGTGRGAYRHVVGRRPDRGDLVDIFDETCCDDVVRIEEQLASIRRLRAGG
jgi:hypothetical protein